MCDNAKEAVETDKYKVLGYARDQEKSSHSIHSFFKYIQDRNQAILPHH